MQLVVCMRAHSKLEAEHSRVDRGLPRIQLGVVPDLHTPIEVFRFRIDVDPCGSAGPVARTMLT